jgi:hypothetical protein
MPNPFLTLITTLATTPTIANTNLNTPNKTGTPESASIVKSISR